MIIALRVILILIFLTAILLQTVLRSVPLKEVRRRARSQKDKKAAAIYKLAAFGPSSELFLYLAVALSAGPLVLMAADYAWWLAVIVVLAVVWLTWMVRPSISTGGWLFRFAASVSPVFSGLVSLLQPILKHPTRWLIRRPHDSTALYEKEDLQDLLKAQARKAENRIPADELKLAFDALGFSDKTVASVMTPRRKIKWVAASEPIGPMTMDELHKTGYNRFPVVKEPVKGGSPEVIGTLHLGDLLENLEEKGRIRDIMLPGINYINESQKLPAAADGFLKSGRHLLIVVNNFEEIAGMLTLEDLFKQVLGEMISSDFDRYGDIRSVASQDIDRADDKEAAAEVE